MAHVEQRQVPLEPTILTIPSENNRILTSGDTPEGTAVELDIPFLDFEKYNKVLNNQEEILRNQRLILKQLATQSVQLDACLKHKVNCSAELNKNKNDDFSFNVIETVKDLETFETKLANEEYLSIFIKHFSMVCGTSGREYGINVCYSLIDKIFSRKLMPQCSWAGGSRGENKKVAFKTYTNVINIFFKLVHAADATFTLDACEQFFKNILKNSTKRSNIQGSRCSKVKRRPKNLAYKLQSEVERHITADNNNEEELEEAESDTRADADAENDTHAYYADAEKGESEADSPLNQETYLN